MVLKLLKLLHYVLAGLIYYLAFEDDDIYTLNIAKYRKPNIDSIFLFNNVEIVVY